MGALLNPWILLGLVLAWGASMGGSFWYGQKTKEDSMLAQEARDEKVQQLASQAAASATAEAIAKIKITNQTIKQEIQREIQTNTVYRECRHTDDQLRRINEAITGVRSPEPSGSGIVPRTDSFVRPLFRGNDK